MTKRQQRAFKVLYPHRFPNGMSVPRSDYYVTERGPLIDLLIRSQGALEVPLRDSPPIPDAPLETQPAPDREPEVDDDVVAEAEPDWDFRTITDMRIWLDQSGAELPSASTRKAGHVEACKLAWASGMRPSPFYGLPGGREPAPGLPGPNATDPEVVEDAIATAEAAGIDVPEELRLHLDALLDPAEEGDDLLAEDADSEQAEEEQPAEDAADSDEASLFEE